ncbi:hypothetical protein RBY4I_76 [Rhodobacterales bacterium Y4I]|nr:hypothetical protein RBY4I_76 [Rhodobacterales bacterium Y4I]
MWRTLPDNNPTFPDRFGSACPGCGIFSRRADFCGILAQS